MSRGLVWLAALERQDAEEQLRESIKRLLSATTSLGEPYLTTDEVEELVREAAQDAIETKEEA